MNNVESASINVSSFFANYKQHSRISIEELTNEHDLLLEVDELVRKMKALDEHLYESMLVSQAFYEALAN